MKIIALVHNEESGLYYGVGQDGEEYFQLWYYPEEQHREPYKQEFTSYEHFVGVLSKFNPYTRCKKEPVEIEKLDYATLESIMPQFV